VVHLSVTRRPPPGRAGFVAAGPVGHDDRVTDLRSRLADARLYLCTDGRRAQGDLPGFLDAVLGGGVDIVQLRDKHLEARPLLERAALVGAVVRPLAWLARRRGPGARYRRLRDRDASLPPS